MRGNVPDGFDGLYTDAVAQKQGRRDMPLLMHVEVGEAYHG